MEYKDRQEQWSGWQTPKIPIEDTQDTIPPKSILPSHETAPPPKLIRVLTNILTASTVGLVTVVIVAVAIKLIRWGLGG